MTAKLDNLGYARVFRHARTGELVVDTDSLRRPGGFSGADFGADRYDDDDDYYDDDDYDDDDDDDEFEGDDFGDEVGDMEGDELGDIDGDIEGDVEGDFGAEGRRRRRHLRRKLGRLNRREDRTRRKLRRNRRKHGVTRKKKVNWGMTAVSGTDTLILAGSASVKIRLQHDFRATDITFTGSAIGAKVTSIFFGDRSVWSSSDGIDVSVFGSTSFLRGLLKGQSLKAGLDITVNGSLISTGDFAVAIIGLKPVHPHC